MNFPFLFGLKSAILLIFFLNGIVFSFLLLIRGLTQQYKASKFLSLLLFLFAMYIAPHMLGYAGWYASRITREILFFVPFMQVLLIGPIVYFYTKSLLNPGFSLSRKDYFHLLPASLYLLYSLVVFVTDKLILDEFYFYADGRDKDLATWYQVVGLISMAIYLVLSLRYYFHYKKLVFNQVSYAETILFLWIRNFLILFLLLLLFRVLFFIINPEWGEFGSQFWYYLVFSFIFYYISIAGYSNVIKQVTLQGEKFNVINVFELEESIEEAKVRKSSLGKEDQFWKDKIAEAMIEKQLFRNPKLTLSEVAKELDTSTKTISTAVNSGFEMNFNDFVNYYRVEAIKDKLNQGEHLQSTLLGIALDSGFNSKATFNRAFKKQTSLSPKEYLDQIQKK